MVVVPFATFSNDPELEYVADRVTDDLTTDLFRISGGFVIARNTAFTLKREPVDVKKIGSELGVRYVIEGGVRRTGNLLGLNVELTDAETGTHLVRQTACLPFPSALVASSSDLGQYLVPHRLRF
jgi:adenylate cyclase